MKEYDVTITETLEKTVTVEAASKAEAEEMVRQQYYNSEYILDSENFTGVDRQPSFSDFDRGNHHDKDKKKDKTADPLPDARQSCPCPPFGGAAGADQND